MMEQGPECNEHFISGDSFVKNEAYLADRKETVKYLIETFYKDGLNIISCCLGE